MDRLKEKLDEQRCPRCTGRVVLKRWRKCDDDWGRFWETMYKIECIDCGLFSLESSSLKEVRKDWDLKYVEHKVIKELESNG